MELVKVPVPANSDTTEYAVPDIDTPCPGGPSGPVGPTIPGMPIKPIGPAGPVIDKPIKPELPVGPVAASGNVNWNKAAEEVPRFATLGAVEGKPTTVPVIAIVAETPEETTVEPLDDDEVELNELPFVGEDW